MGKLIFLITLALAAYYLYSTGILTSLNNGNQAILGKSCEVSSPYDESVYIGANKRLASVPIDATIGNDYLRLPAKNELQRCLKNGSIAKLPNHTKVKVLGNDKVVLYAIPHGLVKIKVLDGDYEGSLGWVERDRVLDTPMHKLFNQIFKPGRLQKD